MQKKKIHKSPKLAKFTTEDLPSAFFENIMDDMTMDHCDIDNALGQMASSAMHSAIELSKLVIENRVRNAEHMTDEDIYNIYRKSFIAVLEGNSVTND